MLRASRVPLGIAEISARAGVHPNTVRFHLDALARNGQVERLVATRGVRGRPPFAYRARRVMDPGGPRDYQLLAGILVESLGSGPETVGRATEAGRSWGAGRVGPRRRRPLSAHRAVVRLVELLADLGFAPQQSGRTSIGLRHCPFLELAQTNADVVCSLHLGLMQGVLAELGAPAAVHALEAFAEPDLCRVQLAIASTYAGPSSRVVTAGVV